MSPIQFALAGICACLTLLLGFELSAAPAMPDIPTLAWQLPPVTIGNALAPPTADSFAAINARPLFNPARKPIAATDQKVASAAPPPDVSLIGVIIEGAARMALVRLATSPLEVSVTVGSLIGGWQVAAIEADHIVLRSGATDHDITLNANRPTDSGPAEVSPTEQPATPANNTP